MSDREKGAYTEFTEPLMDTVRVLWMRSKKTDIFRCFDRDAPEKVRMCDADGMFPCTGPVQGPKCPFGHVCYGYDLWAQREGFIMFQLHHIISRKKIKNFIKRYAQRLYDIVETEKKNGIFNEENQLKFVPEYFFELLSTSKNLRLLHIMCHKLQKDRKPVSMARAIPGYSQRLKLFDSLGFAMKF